MPRKSYAKNKITRDHEMQLEMIKVFQGEGGFEKMLLMGVLGGASIAALASAMGITLPESGKTLVDPVSGEPVIDPITGQPWKEEGGVFGRIGHYALKITGMHPDGTTSTSNYQASQNVKDAVALVMVAGTSFSAFCGMLLVLRATMGEQGLGGIIPG